MFTQVLNIVELGRGFMFNWGGQKMRQVLGIVRTRSNVISNLASPKQE